MERFNRLQGVHDAQDIASTKHPEQSLFFFPEGTFTRVSGLQNFHMGAFITAASANFQIVPIAIRGTRSMLRSGTWMPSRGQITITIGEVITPEVEEASADQWATAVKLKQAAHYHILSNCGEVDLSYRSSSA